MRCEREWEREVEIHVASQIIDSTRRELARNKHRGEIWEKLKLSLERKKRLFYPFAHQRHANQLHKFDRGILESNSIADFGFIKENRIESGDFAFWK